MPKSKNKKLNIDELEIGVEVSAPVKVPISNILDELDRDGLVALIMAIDDYVGDEEFTYQILRNLAKTLIEEETAIPQDIMYHLGLDFQVTFDKED